LLGHRGPRPGHQPAHIIGVRREGPRLLAVGRNSLFRGRLIVGRGTATRAETFRERIGTGSREACTKGAKRSERAHILGATIERNRRVTGTGFPLTQQRTLRTSGCWNCLPPGQAETGRPAGPRQRASSPKRDAHKRLSSSSPLSAGWPAHRRRPVPPIDSPRHLSSANPSRRRLRARPGWTSRCPMIATAVLAGINTRFTASLLSISGGLGRRLLDRGPRRGILRRARGLRRQREGARARPQGRRGMAWRAGDLAPHSASTGLAGGGPFRFGPCTSVGEPPGRVS